jgi:hypothetical protein
LEQVEERYELLNKSSLNDSLELADTDGQMNGEEEDVLLFDSNESYNLLNAYN